MQALADDLLQLDLYNPQFRSFTSNRYFSHLRYAPFSVEESEYIATAKPITLYFNADSRPFSFKDEQGVMSGIIVDVMNEIGRRTGLKFRFRNKADAGRVAFLDGKYTYYIRDPSFFKYDQKATESLVGYDYCLYGRLGYPFNPSRKDYSVALVKKQEEVRTYIQTLFPEGTILLCDDTKGCIDAVLKGKVDCAFVCTFMANDYLVSSSVHTVSVLSTSRKVFDFGLSISDDEMLIRIIDKGLKMISDDDLEHIVLKYALSATPELDLLFFIQNYPLQSLLMVSVILILIVLVLFIVLRSRQRQQLERKNRELKEANAAKSQFLSRMSHDIRTPMNAIIGMTQLAKEEAKDPKAMQYYLDQIGTSGDFLLSLINDILDVSRIEQGVLHLNPEPYRFGTFLKEMNAVLQPLFDAKQITFEVKSEGIEEDDVFIFDHLRINQIVLNLLSNAAKFTQEKGSVSLTVSLRKGINDANLILLRVNDNGQGMSKAFQSHLFQPFMQEDEFSGTGSGIGLSIVLALVKLMDGTISCKSEEGKGTEFLVSIPGIRGKCASAPATSSQSENENPMVGKHVLICEDHPVNAVITERLLEKKGILWDCASDGEEGVVLFSASDEGYYDAILMDIRMPRMNGLECARAIRSLDRADAHSIPIIAMTANAYDSDVKASLDAGMNEHLAKPIKADLLYKVLSRVFSHT